MSKYKGAYGRVTLLALLALVMVIVSSCGTNKSAVNKEIKDSAADGANADASVTGVITKINTSLRQITMRELDSNVDTLLNYNNVSVITNKFDEEIEGDALEVGQIFEATYASEDGKIEKMSVPKDAWEYQDVSSFSFDRDIKALSLADQRFQYSDSTNFIEGNKTIDLMEINDKDMITVRGVGIKVYSVVKSAGHGYIKFSNYEDFIGGMVSVGNGIIVPVTDNMLITAGVGSYKVTISKGNAVASKKVTVRNNKEVTVDFGDYVPEVKNVGNIKFNIDPKGADLYINGTIVDYSNPIALNYGEYKVKVELTGYTTYNGVLDVEDASKTINISLIEKDASVADATSTPSSSPSPSGSSDSDSNVTTKKTDSKHVINVLGPAGAAVYLDNVYQGVAPCKFTKIIGSQTITLSKTGYLSKSYSVNILDNNKDIKLDFPELIEAADDNKNSSTDNSNNK